MKKGYMGGGPSAGSILDWLIFLPDGDDQFAKLMMLMEMEKICSLLILNLLLNFCPVSLRKSRDAWAFVPVSDYLM